MRQTNMTECTSEVMKHQKGVI